MVEVIVLGLAGYDVGDEAAYRQTESALDGAAAARVFLLEPHYLGVGDHLLGSSVAVK
jgi:hypothetical protein